MQWIMNIFLYTGHINLHSIVENSNTKHSSILISIETRSKRRRKESPEIYRKKKLFIANSGKLRNPVMTLFFFIEQDFKEYLVWIVLSHYLNYTILLKTELLHDLLLLLP